MSDRTQPTGAHAITRFLRTPLAQLPLSAGAHDTLATNGILFPGDLLALTRARADEMVGQDTLAEIGDAFAPMGLCWRPEHPDATRPPAPSVAGWRRLAAPINDLGASVRLKNCLARLECVCLGDVLRLPPATIRQAWNMGARTYAELNELIPDLEEIAGRPETLAALDQLTPAASDEPEPCTFDGMPIEDALIGYLTERTRERDLTVLLRRLGLFDGDTPETLQQIALDFGVSHERVRQIQARAQTPLDRLEDPLTVFPQIARGLNIISEMAPGRIAEVAPALVEDGVCRNFEPFRQIVQTLDVDRLDTVPTASGPALAPDSRTLNTVRSHTRAQIHECGITELDEIARACDLTPRQAARYLTHLDEFRVLDHAHITNSRFPHDNRLGSRLRKLYAVSPRFTECELATALTSGSSEFHVSLPAPAALRAGLERLGGYRDTPQGLELRAPEPPAAVLSASEITLYRILEDHGGALPPGDIIDAAAGQEMPAYTTRAILYQSVIFQQVERGIIGLRGRQVSPATLTRCRQAQERIEREITCACVDADTVTVRFTATRSTIQAAPLQARCIADSVPDGGYALRDPDDQNLNSLRVEDGTLHNIPWALQQIGARPGERYHLILDTRQGCARILPESTMLAAGPASHLPDIAPVA